MNRRQGFNELRIALDVIEANIPGFDVESRWSSTNSMLESAVKSKRIQAVCVLKMSS